MSEPSWSKRATTEFAGGLVEGLRDEDLSLQHVTDRTCDLEKTERNPKGGSKKPGPGRIGKPRQAKGRNRWKPSGCTQTE